jgi:hypothetical protein
MAHCIHVIVASRSTAEAIFRAWPELPRLDRGDGFVLFPVSAELIDARIAPETTPTDTGDSFMLLTPGFRSQLRSLSRDGLLAYVETEYFGGVGGQGALVCRNGEEIMPPTWDDSGIINAALRLLDVPRGLLTDRFAAVGFAQVRSNDDILDLIAKQIEG